MVNKVNLNTPEGRKNYFVKHGVMGGAVPVAIGMGVATGADFLMNKAAMKDEFKAAKQAVKDAKAQNLSKDAIKEAKKGVTELYSKVAKNTFGGENGKQIAIATAAAIGVVTLIKGVLQPAVSQYLNRGKADKAAAETEK